MTGIHPWAVGDQTVQLSVSSSGLSDFWYFEGDTWPTTQSWNSILAQNYSGNQLEDQNALLTSSTRNSVKVIEEALSNAAEFTSMDGINSLANQLKVVAKLIHQRQALSQQRQIFFVGLGGWDTHGNQMVNHANRLGQLDAALFAFQEAINNEASIDNDSVTTFSASEFGRSLTINGDGTDHAWGAHAMVMGGAVNGGKVFGSLPSLRLGGDDDARENGRLIPTMSIDQYGAALAAWYGLTPTEISAIFPNLGNFSTDTLNNLFV